MANIVSTLKVKATYMRGGTSKGVFFNIDDLPHQAAVAGAYRDNFLLRVVGSPDSYGKHTDGMGGATSSTSKAVLVAKSASPEHDVDYYFGQVAIDKAFVDWTGNCGNLTAAVGAFAIHEGLVADVPENGIATVRIWQRNIDKTLVVHVPMQNGEVLEQGDYTIAGVDHCYARINVDFIDPAEGAVLPTANLTDTIEVEGVGSLEVSLINAGIATVFFNAQCLGLTATELQDAVNNNPQLLTKLEAIRAAGAVKMGLINDVSEAATRAHTPKVAWVSSPCDYTASSGETIKGNSINLNVRAMSMGKLHHAMMGTCAVAIASAASIKGTLVEQACAANQTEFTFGHPSGTMVLDAASQCIEGTWQVQRVTMGRSARVLMEGRVHCPADI
ncbi:2-methylaconitate cis-trans isomerase PrpF [Paraferrimonas sp. SM1919]|uniref:2-methylaconitate cis-trans isomerase PrpF n=1 Tax=Paraferrimonas sp. SM1919 TaxID=2662263 RepID=UPI0013D4DD98|nr:2-methylaconitate cis-trans isomerase PrpF [Paraferrimonas sp. SM1919]